MSTLTLWNVFILLYFNPCKAKRHSGNKGLDSSTFSQHKIRPIYVSFLDCCVLNKSTFQNEWNEWKSIVVCTFYVFWTLASPAQDYQVQNKSRVQCFQNAKQKAVLLSKRFLQNMLSMFLQLHLVLETLIKLFAWYC